MRGIRHCLIAACLCGLILAPSGASGDDWAASEPEWETADSFDAYGSFGDGGASIVSPIQIQEGLAAASLNPNGLAYQNGFLYGLKLRLLCQTGWIPANTFVVQGFSPTLSDTKKSQVQATYAFGWELAPR